MRFDASGLSAERLKELLLVRYRTWTLTILCFVLSQAVNVWAGMPDFSQWDFIFGFPLAYLMWQDSAGYIYFNVLVMLLDVLIVYVAVRLALYAYGQITKYQMPQEPAERKK